MSKRYTTEKSKKAFKSKVKNLGGQHCYPDFDRYGNPRIYVWKKVGSKTGPRFTIGQLLTMKPGLGVRSPMPSTVRRH